MITDIQLAVFANVLGVTIFLLVIAYHYLVVNGHRSMLRHHGSRLGQFGKIAFSPTGASNSRLICHTTKAFNATNEENKVSMVAQNNNTQFVLTGNKKIDDRLNGYIQKAFQLMGIYEEMIGLKELKNAQNSVIEAERKFIEAQETRRTLNAKMLDIQSKLKGLRDQMDRLSRTDSSYLKLFTQEHETLNEEKLLLHDYHAKESQERDLFFQLSASLRDSQEKERARAERIKYLQLSLSIACTFLGLISALLFSFLRKTEIREILDYEKSSFQTLSNRVDLFQSGQEEFLKLLRDYMNKPGDGSQNDKHLSQLLNRQNELIEQNVDSIKKLLNTNQLAFLDHDVLEAKLNSQQNLLKLLSVTTILSTAFLFVNYFYKP